MKDKAKMIWLATSFGDDYVEKPFLPDILLERVGKLIRKKQKSRSSFLNSAV